MVSLDFSGVSISAFKTFLFEATAATLFSLVYAYPATAGSLDFITATPMMAATEQLAASAASLNAFVPLFDFNVVVSVVRFMIYSS